MAQGLRSYRQGTWDLPESGIKPWAPALACGFLTTESPGKPWSLPSLQKESKAQRGDLVITRSQNGDTEFDDLAWTRLVASLRGRHWTQLCPKPAVCPEPAACVTFPPADWRAATWHPKAGLQHLPRKSYGCWGGLDQVLGTFSLQGKQRSQFIHLLTRTMALVCPPSVPTVAVESDPLSFSSD